MVREMIRRAAVGVPPAPPVRRDGHVQQTLRERAGRRGLRGESTRRAESPWRCVAAPSRPRRGDSVAMNRGDAAAATCGYSVKTRRGDAAAATRRFRGHGLRRRRGRDAEIPWL